MSVSRSWISAIDRCGGGNCAGDSPTRVDLRIVGSYNLARALSIRAGCVDLANETGKRYICGKCGSEFIVTKGGSGSVACCNEPMSIKK